MHDPAGANARWTDDELALWITDGQRTIAVRKPDSVAINATYACVAGSKQSIAGMTPPGRRLLDIVQATATGRPVRLVDRETLDTYHVGWHKRTAGVPRNYVYDNRDPRTFYVEPPAVLNTALEIIYSPEPPTVLAAGLGNDLLLDDLWSGTLLNYVLFRAYAKDAEDSHNAGLAAAYAAAFDGDLGGKARADVLFSPDMNNPGGAPTTGATAGGV